MKATIDKIITDIDQFVINDTKTLEDFRIQFLGSKGIVKNMFGELKSVPNEEKREVGQLLNNLRLHAETKFASFKEQLETAAANDSSLDLSRPGDMDDIGARHPLSLVRSEIIEIFEGARLLRFEVEEEEIENA